MSHEKIASSLLRVEEAESELRRAKEEHEEEFRQALVRLFNEYRMSVEANGSEGARLEVNEITHTFTREMLDW